ncbi:polyprenyl synthetase family protein [Nocardia takedensis]|uniref:polyprenyl synthetase family protein n=1 Tax=Nocardia takedensis TaxID=259390 RepID=UPI0003154E11|nr:polyprenyl synthetase family protein [Nocardia takedensis]
MSIASAGPVSHSAATGIEDRADRDPGSAAWPVDVRERILAEVGDFLAQVPVARWCPPDVPDVLRQYATGGKCLRSTFMYLGWLCGADADAAALRASASLELLHAFALLQDDVMDEAVLRRGEPAAHLRLSGGSPPGGPVVARRFGESAATLLGDLCLVWGEQMLRDSGVDAEALSRVWRDYDAMRVELALGQYADLGNDIRTRPSLEDVLTIARAKSGNYTVARPLELGAAMAGCAEPTSTMLARYGLRIGEAFQLRDDLLGVFGSAAVTGKPEDSDLGQHKATTVLVVALECADPGTGRELWELVSRPVLDAAAIARCRQLIAKSGAPERVEAMIADRVERAREDLHQWPLPRGRHDALDRMARLCTARQL